MKGVSAILLAALVPGRIVAQAARAPFDSVGLASAVAAHLVADSSRDPWSGVIDTAGNRWNALVRRAVLVQAPSRLPTLTDSAAYYTYQFSVTAVAPDTAGVAVSVEWQLCYRGNPGGFSYAFTKLSWRFRQSPAGWEYVDPAKDPSGPHQVTIGDGICAPWKRRGGR